MEHSLIQRLRNATGQVHKDLEALPVSKIMLSPELTTAGYIDYLNRMYVIHHFSEQEVFPVAAAHVMDIEERRKTALIAHDLAALNAPVPATDGFADDGFRKNPAFCLGMLYVSEGSTLGGQYILKHVQQVLGAQAGDAITFLNAYGPRTGSRWKAFTEMLHTYETMVPEAELQEVEAGAVYGFERTAVVFGGGAGHN